MTLAVDERKFEALGGYQNALSVHVLAERIRKDPLQVFKWPGEPHRLACSYHAQGLTTSLRGSNDSGKSKTGAAIVAATLRGWSELSGEPLPKVSMPATWLCIVQSCAQQVDSSQAALFYWLGNHPHKINWGPKANAEIVWIATPLCSHGMGEKCSTCSKLTFHSCESGSLPGAKVDGVWIDEPCTEEIWNEAVNRGKGDHLFYILGTWTPIDIYFWHWMPGWFDGTERRPTNGLVEVRATMEDNCHLSAEVKAQKIALRRNDPQEAARLRGDYVHLKGENPFPHDRLEMWMRRTRPPKPREITVRAKRDSRFGGDTVEVRALLEMFYAFEPDEVYVGVLDPATFLRIDPNTGLVVRQWASRGSNQRGVPDPCGGLLFARRNPRLVSRFSGYIGSYGLGSVGALWASEYRNVTLDVDLTGGHGDPCVQALRDAGYYDIPTWHPQITRPSRQVADVGFTITVGVRNRFVDSIQRCLIDDAVMIESEEVVKSLMGISVKITPSGAERPEAGYGSKDEDMICLGRALCMMEDMPLPPRRQIDPFAQLRRVSPLVTSGGVFEHGDREEDDTPWFGP